MSSNIFNSKRFALLFRQHFIQSAQLLLLSTVAYVGIIFIVLSIVQIGDNLDPHRLDSFQAFLVTFVSVFGILYAGHSFPAFRSKESTITYLMMPASALEKFLFELVTRGGIVLLILPLLYWITFNLQGYFFSILTYEDFDAIGIQHLVRLGDGSTPVKDMLQIYTVIAGGILFVISLVFTGSSIFEKQPLVKSLFAVAMIVLFFVGYSYVVVEHLGVGRYHPPEKMILIPNNEFDAFTYISVALFIGTAVMLFVAFRKVKEREV